MVTAWSPGKENSTCTDKMLGACPRGMRSMQCNNRGTKLAAMQQQRHLPLPCTPLHGPALLRSAGGRFKVLYGATPFLLEPVTQFVELCGLLHCCPDLPMSE